MQANSYKSGYPSAHVPRASPWDRVIWTLDALWVLALGALHSLPAAYPQLWGLQLFCVAGFAYRISRVGPGRAALLGGLFGTAWLGAAVWWLFISMHRYGGLSALLSGLAVLALCVFLSFYLAAGMAVFATLRRNRVGIDALLFGSVWLLAEWARAVIFTGFPWAASGYAHVDGPLAVLAPLIGVYGIGAVSAVLGAVVAFGLRLAGQALVGGVIGLLVSASALLLLSYTPVTQHTLATSTLKLSLLQTNVPQNEKFASAMVPQALDWASTAMRAARSDLVMAPETVIPLLPGQVPDSYWQPLLKHFQKGEQSLLMGMVQGTVDAGFTNSAVGISRATSKYSGGIYRYDKHHLVPFGEFIPPGFRWFTQRMHIPLGDFNRGPQGALSFPVKGERVAPTICYEDLFGEEIAARFIDPMTAPTVLANQTNIGWFGDTIALPQHLQISRMRTLEFQLPMVRATNTGTTAVINHEGQITHALPSHTLGVLEASVQGRQGLTPFADWASRYGLWPLVLLALVPMLLCLPLRRQD
jgi:apolipoprotein N-acyltransferase